MKYEPIFKLSYSNVFITDIIFKVTYKYLDAIAIIKNGKWELFIEREFLEKIAEQRFNDVIKGLDFKKFEEYSLKLSKELIEIKDTDVGNLTDEEFLSFLDKIFYISGKFMPNYSKTEFIYFKKIESVLGDYIKNKFSFEEVLSGDADLSLFPEEMRKLADYIINMQHLKFELRKTVNEVFMGPDALLSKVLEQLVKRTGREDATSMTLDEFRDCLNGKSIKDVSDRHVYSYITWEDDKPKILSGGEAYRKIRELDKMIPKNEVIGTPAFKGIVKGRVKVIPLSINPEKYLPKMQKGDILVSDTTGPEMMIAIEKASGIVTDEGGMMSHAAIVAREFQIPCVVGTKFATEVFKDGDFIEVNANNGIVRLIEKYDNKN